MTKELICLLLQIININFDVLSIEDVFLSCKEIIVTVLNKYSSFDDIYLNPEKGKLMDSYMEEKINYSMKDFGRSSFLINGYKIGSYLTRSMLDGYLQIDQNNQVSCEVKTRYKNNRKGLELAKQFYNKGRELRSKSNEGFLLEAFKYMFDVSCAKAVPNNELLKILVYNMNQNSFTGITLLLLNQSFLADQYRIFSISCDRDNTLDILIAYYKCPVFGILDDDLCQEIDWELLKQKGPYLDSILTFKIKDEGNYVIKCCNIKFKAIIYEETTKKDLIINYDITEHFKNKNLLYKIQLFIMYFVYYIKEYFNKIFDKNNVSDFSDYSETFHRLFQITEYKGDCYDCISEIRPIIHSKER